MPTVYVDADACPVKDEVYRVTARYGVRVVVVANAPMRVPASERIALVCAIVGGCVTVLGTTLGVYQTPNQPKVPPRA